MATILDEIVEVRRCSLEIDKQQTSLESIRDQVHLSDRDFAAALRTEASSFILECKKASPSRGLIRPDFDLHEIAKVYGKHASAISVLTESKYFQGSFEYLRILRPLVTQPLLCKDFIVDPYQVYQARLHGADAILLILAILDDELWAELFQLAQSLGMDVLTEISNSDEQQRAIQLKAPIVGINNRDLRDMSIDLDTTMKLSNGLSDDTLVVSESGYASNRDVRRMSQYCDAFLVGSSLMSQQNLGAAVKSIIYGDNKVCGLTRNVDAIAAAKSGAVYGGVIFANGSSRQVDPSQVEVIFQDTDLLRVGVFQDHSTEQIVKIASELKLDVIQFHGDETFDQIREVRDLLGQHPIFWKALSVEELSENVESFSKAGVKWFLVDNKQGSQRGGTGKVFDWNRFPEQYLERAILAGGIGPDNVQQAMATGVLGVDMNSAVEYSPGIKSNEKIERAFQQLRQFGRSIQRQG